MEISLFHTETSKLTEKKKFLKKIEEFLPINEWMEIVKPIYYKEEVRTGRPKKELEIILRAYVVKICFGLSCEKAEDEIQESISVRNFCGVTNDKDIPDAISLYRFETLLTEHEIQKEMFEQQVDTLKAEGKIIKIGTIVDSTIIDAPTSAKKKKRDQEAGWTKKQVTNAMDIKDIQE